MLITQLQTTPMYIFDDGYAYMSAVVVLTDLVVLLVLFIFI